MAGTVTVTRMPQKALSSGKAIQKIKVDWIADASNGSVPNTLIQGMNGLLVKVITSPGTPNPTLNYQVKLLDPDFPTFDALENKFNNLSATAIAELYPANATQIPLLLAGDYTFNLTGNVVNSAQGTVMFYIVEGA